MVILRTRNKITDFLMILAWASPFNLIWRLQMSDSEVDPYAVRVNIAQCFYDLVIKLCPIYYMLSIEEIYLCSFDLQVVLRFCICEKY